MKVEAKGKDPNTGKNVDESNDLNKSDIELGGRIVLSGFSLEPIEMIVVKKIVGTYAKKISEKGDYDEIKITLKKVEKNKMFLHTIKANVKLKNNKILSSESEHKNLYTALSEVLDKIYEQAEK